MILNYFLAWIFLTKLSVCQDTDYDDYEDSGYYEEYSGSGEDYDYNYEYGENGGYGEQYEYETKYEDSELEYVPEITSEALSLEVKVGGSVELPCEATDAAKFVRVWMKGDIMIFTGSHRLHQDERFLLSGPGNSSLTILTVLADDSGRYECRIMVPDKPVSISHTVMVTTTLTIQAVPREGVVRVPLRGLTSIGCKVGGDMAAETSIVWSRDSRKFRDKSYSYVGDYITLDNVTLQDAGLYYCRAQSSDGTTKTASVQVQVLFPPIISTIEETSVQGGKGSEKEISCIVTGEPSPRVTWYKDGEVIKLTDNIETQIAGTRHVLLIHNMQESDYGQYMCYATNSMGSRREEVEIADTDNRAMKADDDKTDDVKDHPQKDARNEYKILQKNVIKNRQTLVEMKDKMETEIENMKNELMSRKTVGYETEDIFSQTILSDIERLDEEYRNLKLTLNGYKTKFEVVERRGQDERQRMWDNIDELQELTNITMRNIDEIYDKDILRLQNNQHMIKGDLKKMKKDISGALNNVVSGVYSPKETGISDMEEKMFVIEDDIKKIINGNKNSRKTIQQFRADLNTAFGDIDELKKEKQANSMEIEHLKRYISKLEVEKIEENMAKIEGMNKIMSNLEEAITKATQRIKRMNKNPGENEKVGVLLKEVQNMKNQMYYLQQSLLQLRTQDHLSLVVSENEVGPAYNSKVSEDLVKIQEEIKSCSTRVETIDLQLKNTNWIEKHEFLLRNEDVDKRFEEYHKTLENTKYSVEECDTKSKATEYEMITLKNQLEKVLKLQEENEKERVKYFLLLHGLRKKRKLERPVHVRKLALSFIETNLDLKGVGVEECSRVDDNSGKRPLPIRIKFSNMKDRNNVLKAGRQLKGNVRISEVFTEQMKNSRTHLTAFARQQSKKTKTKWALQQDKLYFNKKIYIFNETTTTVEAVADIA